VSAARIEAGREYSKLHSISIVYLSFLRDLLLLQNVSRFRHLLILQIFWTHANQFILHRWREEFKFCALCWVVQTFLSNPFCGTFPDRLYIVMKFISVINQLDAQNLFHSKFYFMHEIKLIVKQTLCASSWLNTEINILRCTVRKTSKQNHNDS